MVGRKKILYLLRQPLAAEQADYLLPNQADLTSGSDITVVLLEEAIGSRPPIAGRIFMLSEDPAMHDRPDAKSISYRELMQFIFDADSTIVI